MIRYAAADKFKRIRMNEYVENFDELISLGTPIFVVAMMLSWSSAVPWSPAPGGSLLLRLIVIARRAASL